VLLQSDPTDQQHMASGTASTDPNKSLAVGLSGLSLLQVMRGEVTGSALENFWKAYRAHTHLSNPGRQLFSLDDARRRLAPLTGRRPPVIIP